MYICVYDYVLSVLVSAAYMVSLLRGQVLLLFTVFRKNLRIDVSELRARSLGREIPPPGWVAPPGSADIILLPDDDAVVFTCDKEMLGRISLQQTVFDVKTTTTAHSTHQRW